MPDEFAFLILGCDIYLFIAIYLLFLLCTSSSHLLVPEEVEILCFTDFKKSQQELYGKILYPHTLQTGTGMYSAGGEILLTRNRRFFPYFTNFLIQATNREEAGGMSQCLYS